MSAIALLIVGGAIMPLEPNLLGCKYGEYLSKPVVHLGAWSEKPERRWLCADGPGSVMAYESFDVLCERALMAIVPEHGICIPIPPGWRPMK